MRSILPAPKPAKEEKPQLMHVYNQGKFFVEPKEVEQGFILRVSLTVEASKEVDRSLDECKEVELNKVEVLPSMEANHCHGIIILHDFKDPFLHNQCNPLIPGVRITVSKLDTTYKIDLTFLIVRLSRFQFQILSSNILEFSEFSEIFLNYFGKSP